MFMFSRIQTPGVPMVVIDGAGATPVKLRRRHMQHRRMWHSLKEWLLLGSSALMIVLLLAISLMGWAEGR